MTTQQAAQQTPQATQQEIRDPLSTANLLRPDVIADPYPFYHRLQSEDPVYWDDAMGYWVVTRYADVVAALRNPRLATDAPEWDSSIVFRDLTRLPIAFDRS